MTRLALLEDFSSRDLTLSKGELVVVLDSERENSYNMLMIKTRHGRKVRVPRSVLGRELVLFTCQLCDVPPISSNRDYVKHLIDHHLHSQLMKGLDNSKDPPICPFPSCTGLSWPNLDNLLYHYASHHNVIDKVLMFETELAATRKRDQLRAKERIVEQLVIENQRLRDKKDCCVAPPGEQIVDESVVKELKSQVEHRNVKIEELQNQVVELKKIEVQVEDVTAENIRLREEVASQKVIATGGMTKMSELSVKVRCLEARLRSANVRESGVSSTVQVNDAVVSSIDCNNNGETGIENLMDKVRRVTEQNETLQLEVENVYLQNENLKNIIEVGKSTVETAKQISHELADENKTIKGREVKNSLDIQNLEKSLNLTKKENVKLCGKYENLLEKHRLKLGEYAQLHENYQKKAEEMKDLRDQLDKDILDRPEFKKLEEKYRRQKTEGKLMEEIRSDYKRKLVNIKEELKEKESSSKVLMLEKKNLAIEIKTLKSHLNANRANIVEKAVAKDEMINLRSELSSKSAELDDANGKLDIMTNELNSAKREQREPCIQDENDVNHMLHRDIESLNTINEELKKQMSTCNMLCEELKKSEEKLQDEISVLQMSLKDSNISHGIKMEDMMNVNKMLQENIVFYKDQQEILDDEITSLKLELKSVKLELTKTDDSSKPTVQSDIIDEFVKKQEKLIAQLRRKDWEIENYQQKLDSTFESQILTGIDQYCPQPENIAAEEVGLTEVKALDLSTRQPELGVDVKVEAVEDGKKKRKLSECSTSDSMEEVSSILLNVNMDTSSDSTNYLVERDIQQTSTFSRRDTL